MQNRLFTTDSNLKACNIIIGSDVTECVQHGDVIIQSDNTVTIKYNDSVTIKNGFECEQGATFSIFEEE